MVQSIWFFTQIDKYSSEISPAASFRMISESSALLVLKLILSKPLKNTPTSPGGG